MLPDGFTRTDSTEPALMFNGRRLAFVTASGLREHMTGAGPDCSKA